MTDRSSAMRLLSLLASACLLVACGTPPDTLYTLSPTIEDAAPEPVPRYTIEVSAISVPELVDRPQFVVRDSDNRVTLLEQQRWASPLTSQMLLVVADDLGRLLPEARVKPTGEAAVADAAYRVAVDVQRFEMQLGRAALFDAQWSARRLADGSMQTGRVRYSEPAGPGYESLAAAQAQAVGKLCREIATAIRADRTLAEARTPPRR